jgi:hypothetical protein
MHLFARYDGYEGGHYSEVVSVSAIGLFPATTNYAPSLELRTLDFIQIARFIALAY